MNGKRVVLAAAAAAVLAAMAARLHGSPPRAEEFAPRGLRATMVAPAAGVAEPETEHGVLRVLVLDLDGRPIEGAEVAAARDGDSRPLRSATDGEGRCRFGALDPADAWLVGARAPGVAPVLAGGARAGGPEVRIVLRPGIRLHGEVKLADGRACPGARVRAVLLFPGVVEPKGGLEARADERGAFEFVGVPAVPVELSGDWNGCRGGPLRAEPDGAAEARRADLVLDSGGAVAGAVRDAAGAPLAGILVTALLPDTGRSVAFAETGADGAFLLGGLEGRPHLVRAEDPSRRLRPSGADGVVPPRDGLDFSLEADPSAPGSFAFRVLDAEGRPVRALRVAEFVPGTNAPVRCGVDGPDADGVFRSAQTGPGPRRIVVRAGEGCAASGVFEIAHGTETDLGTLRLAPGVTVHGRLLGPDGAPATGAAVFAGGDLLPERGQPDAAGRFSVAGLPPGEGRLRFALTRCEVGSASWQGGAGSVVDLGEVRLRAARGVVRGVARWRGGTVPAAARATLRPDDEAIPRGLERTAEVGADGFFEFGEVPAGRWYAGVLVPAPVEGRRPGDPLPSRGRAAPSFDLPEGGRHEVEIDLE